MPERGQAYYGSFIEIYIKGEGSRKFYLDTGSISSLISLELLDESDKFFFYTNNNNISAANSGKLQVQGVTN